jgi:hypothetical protein
LHDGVETFPEFIAAHAGVGQHFGLDEFVQVGGNLQAAHLGALGGVLAHGEVSLDKSKRGKSERILLDCAGWIASSAFGLS